MMNILVADDQTRVRYALRVLLEQRADWKVIGEATEAGELLAQPRGAEADLVLLDGELPGLKDGDLQRIREVCPRAQIVVLSEQPVYNQRHPAAGPDALASKTNPPEELLATIQRCVGNVPA
jgi:DNA-binding NarL/FixJ family response regulator